MERVAHGLPCFEKRGSAGVPYNVFVVSAYRTGDERKSLLRAFKSL